MDSRSVALKNLNPVLLDQTGMPIELVDGKLPEGVTVTGLEFTCPCKCGSTVFCMLSPPGAGSRYEKDFTFFGHNGYDVEKMTLTPSVWRKKEDGGCGWHGWVEGGSVRPAW